MSLQFLDLQNNSHAVKKLRRRAFRTRMVRAFPAVVQNTEVVSATVNGGTPVTYMIDSGATYTILASTTAASVGFNTSNPTRQQAVTTVSGQTQANVFAVSFKINDTPAFQTEILVMESAFNLLSTEDLSKAYSVTLAPGGVGFHLTPLGQAPTTPPPPTPTVPQQPPPTQPSVPPPAPQPPSLPSLPTTMPRITIGDILRQLHQILCGGPAKIPIICNNPQIFTTSMLFLGLLMLILIIRGMF